MTSSETPTPRNFDGKTALKATLGAVVSVVALAALTMVFLDHSDFEAWGWLIGPVAWVVSCVVGARLGGLSVIAGLVGAVVAGIPSGLATMTGLHWLGIVVGLAAFAAWAGSGRAGRL